MRATKTSTRGFNKPVSSPSRGKKESEILEEEARRMEEQLKEIRNMVSKEREKEGTKAWANARKDLPRVGYGRYILEKKQKEAEIKAKQKGAKSTGKPFIQTQAPAPKKIVKDQKGENIFGIKTQKVDNVNVTENVQPDKLQKIAVNFAKAKVEDDKKEYSEVENFLESISMGKYMDLFITNGFEDLESILELREEHFHIMGIPLGHKLKMLKKIKELRKEDQLKASTAVEFAGEFNEEESHKAFLEAREAWLKERQKEKEAKSIATQNQGTDSQTNSTKAKTGFLSIAGGDTWNVPSMPEYAEEGTNMSPKNIPKRKESCFGCFKLFAKGTGFEDGLIHKVFCNETCFHNYFESNSITCVKCSQRFLKETGVMQDGIWLCSDSCTIKEIIQKNENEEDDDEGIEKEMDDMLKLE